MQGLRPTSFTRPATLRSSKGMMIRSAPVSQGVAATTNTGSYPSWVPWAIIAAAALVRLLHIGDWSMWEDEETSIFFALNPDRSFPRSFPLYFWLLGFLFDMTGVSILAARLLTASIGIGALWLVYRTTKRFCGDDVAVPALVLLSISIGHVFWSQSIRYYVLVLAFQMLSVHAFLSAVERPRLASWGLSAFWFLLALASHATAALLLPVYGAFIGFLALRRTPSRTWLVALLMLAALGGLIASIWIGSFTDFAAAFSGPAPAPAMRVLERTILYGGVPAVALGLAAVALERRGGPRLVFFGLLAVVPVIELMAIGTLGFWWALWYHGLISLVGIAVVGGYGWRMLAQRAPRSIVLGAGAAVAIPSLALLVVYHTVAYGDRPRWREAALAVKEHARAAGTGALVVAAHSPGVVAHYLGVPPGETMGYAGVKQWNRRGELPRGAGYAIVIEVDIPVESRWLRAACEPIVSLPSRMIMRDRTVSAFWCGGGF